MERGVAVVTSYLQHQMAKEAKPEDQITRWIEGALAQVADPHLISMSRAVVDQMSADTTRGAADGQIMRPMRDLLIAPVTALGRPDPQRDADAIFHCTAAIMRRYVGATDGPGRADINHLVRFCLGGLGVTRTGRR
jgi:hypothetical protein